MINKLKIIDMNVIVFIVYISILNDFFYFSENRILFAKLSKLFIVNNEWNADLIFVKSMFWSLNDFSCDVHDFKISVNLFRMICRTKICQLSKLSLLIESTIVFYSLLLLNEIDLKIWWSVLIAFRNNSVRSK